MKQFDIKEYNKMCAEFLGGIEYIPKPWYYFPIHQRHWFFPNRLEPNRFVVKMLKFDTDWNWIMEVVEKIERLEYEFVFYCHNNWIEPHRVVIRTYRNKEIICISSNNKKEAVVKAIWEFLIWHQEQSKNE